MADELGATVIDLERQRIAALLAVDIGTLDAVHDDAYRLCQPAGAVWGKIEYLGRLASGRLAYRRLAVASDIDVLVADTLAVLYYRCVIALDVEDVRIEAHECRHVDVYRRGIDDRWRCRYSQATAIAGTVPTGSPRPATCD